MRIEVTCRNEGIKAIPINYQYYLTSAIYRAIGLSDSEMSEKLHNDGFGNEMKMKMFTYSFLRGKTMKMTGEEDLAIEGGSFMWYIASPFKTILEKLAEGLCMIGSLEIKHDSFQIEKIAFKGNPRLNKEEMFICDSPIVVTKQHDSGRVEYLTEIDEEYNIRINNNLARKYRILFGEEYKGDGIKIISERNYPSTKLVKFKDIRIKGIFDAFYMVGDTDLMHIAYDSGIGEKNSMGFGMIERRKNI